LSIAKKAKPFESNIRNTNILAMLRGTEKWVTYIVLAIVFIFGVIFLLQQIHTTVDLKDALSSAKQTGATSGDLKSITNLHNASAKIFFLSFFAFCLLLIGIITIMRAVERAYDIAEVKEKVRIHLKSATPGIVMVVISSFLLAFCSFRVAHIESEYTARLMDYNNEKIALQNWMKPETTIPLQADTVAIIQPPKKETSNKTSKSRKTAASSTSKPAVNKSSAKAEKKNDAVAHRENSSNTKQAIATNTSSKKEMPASQKASQKEHKSAMAAANNHPAPPLTRVTPEDIQWANQFQRNVTIYGYVPSDVESSRYRQVRKYYEQNDGGLMNDDLNWAYSFLEKTKKGYQPKAGELQRYESIIEQNIKSSAANTDGQPLEF
jgi:hypothetical protein